MNDCPVVPVSDFAEKVVIGPFGSRMKADAYVADGVPVIRGTNLTGGRELGGEWVYVTNETANELVSCNTRKGDLVFPHRGAIGEVGLVPGKRERYMLSTSLMMARCNPALAIPEYVYYFFKSGRGRYELLKNASQVGTPGIGQPLTSLKSIGVPLPPLQTQAAIAEALGSLDDKIELNRRTSQSLEAMAQAAFKSWFIDFEPLLALRSGLSSDEVARGFALQQEALRHFETDLLSIEGQPLPMGWRISSLGEEVRSHGGLLQTGPFGSQLHASDYADEGVPVVMPQDMVGRRVTTTRIARVPQEVADSLSRHKLQAGDIVYSRRGDVERHARVTSRETGWLCGTGCLLVRMGSSWPSHTYLSEFLNYSGTRQWIVRHAVGATMPNLNTSILSALPLLVPPLELLQEYERVVAPLIAQQEALSAEAESLTQLRDELLPRLLSGELVVP